MAAFNLDQFLQDFMRRTRQIVEDYPGKYDATLLLNCMVGLLIVPRERMLRYAPGDDISEIGKWGIPLASIQSYPRVKKYGESYNIAWFMIKLRNAVAHSNFTPKHDEAATVSGFEFWDRDGFRAIIGLYHLRQFLIRLSEHLGNLEECRESAQGPDGPRPTWEAGAKRFRAYPDRVYVIDCPGNLQRRCYEIATSSVEYYTFGSSADLLTEGATDCIVEPDEVVRRHKIVELTTDLAKKLPPEKRLSIYSNDSKIQDELRPTALPVAESRLAFFAVYRIEGKRTARPVPVIRWDRRERRG